jgi:hypothetical protein
MIAPKFGSCTFITVMSVLLSLLAVSLGCGSGKAQRFDLNGKITYRGQPVPGGRLLFEPDAEAGNSGSGSVAEIANGQYRTRSNKGTVGGPHVVTIFGTNGKTATETYDNSLFSPYQKKVDLPREDATLDFEVPNDHH